MKQLCVLIVLVVAARAVGVLAQEQSDSKKPPSPPVATADRINLKDGKSLTGTLLDLTDKKAVIEVAGETKTFQRAQVSSVSRVAPASLLAIFERKSDALKAEGKVEEWKGLAAFCGKEKLLPERRRALREIVRFEPENVEARTELGHAQLGDRWLDEDEVALKLKEGFRVVARKLVKDGGAGTTVVRKEETSDRYRILPRQKLTSDGRKKLEKDREDRLKSAAKFLAAKQEEYNGIDWSRRHIVKTKNFEIQCNSTLNVARAYGALMEMIRTELSEMFTSSNQRGNQRATISIYASQEEFISTDRLGRFMGRGLGGYYRPDTQGITTFHGTFGFTGTTFSVLCHEGTHYYQGLVLKDFDNIPIWLIEGLAVYFGDGSKFDPKAKKITIGLIPRDRLAHIQEKMLLKRQQPLAKLVSMTRNDRNNPFSGSEYADAWALIYFLVNSGEKGKDLLTDYWKIGLNFPLKKEHFVGLATKYFGGIEAMEKQYVDYILKLDMPSAGKVTGDYFVSDTFQFDYKAPAPEWEFFEDKDDKRMLIGLFLPNTSAEIRIYYTNNDTWADAKTYFGAYTKLASAQFKDFKHDETKDVLKSGSLEWRRVTYTQPAGAEGVNVSGELGGLGSSRLPQPEPGKDAAKAADGKKKKEPLEVTRYFLIQIDGVVEIACSTKQGEAHQFDDVFAKAHESFTLSFARRW